MLSNGTSFNFLVLLTKPFLSNIIIAYAELTRYTGNAQVHTSIGYIVFYKGRKKLSELGHSFVLIVRNLSMNKKTVFMFSEEAFIY